MLEVKGDSAPDQQMSIAFPDKQLPSGTHRYSIRVYTHGKLGTTVLRASKPFKVEQPPEGSPPSGGGTPPVPTTNPAVPSVPLPVLPPLPPLPGP